MGQRTGSGHGTNDVLCCGLVDLHVLHDLASFEHGCGATILDSQDGVLFPPPLYSSLLTCTPFNASLCHHCDLVYIMVGVGDPVGIEFHHVDRDLITTSGVSPVP